MALTPTDPTIRGATLLDNLPFEIEEVRILREMRIPSLKKIDELEEKPLADAIRGAIDAGYRLIRGRGVYRTFRISGLESGKVTGPVTGPIFEGPKLVELLSVCDYATLLVCTIGPELEAEVERLQAAGDMTAAYALEMVGGWMADYMADRVDERIEREIVKGGYGRTMRFSPGYGDWPLDHQPRILALCEAERIGVTLNEANIMLPRKSVSAVIGWTSDTTG